MGFGYIFVGTALTVNVVAHSYTDLIAYLLILIGMLTLKDYGQKLHTAYLAAWPLLAVGLLELVLVAADLLDFGLSPVYLQEASFLNQLFLLIFTFLLLRGLRILAKETETFALETRVFRNQLFALLYHLPMLFISIPFESTAVRRVQATMFFPFLLFGFVYLILEAKLIFSFYMWICPQGEEDMERKPSRIPLLNSLYRLSDKIDERTAQRKQEETAQKNAERLRRQREKQSRHQKRKK